MDKQYVFVNNLKRRVLVNKEKPTAIDKEIIHSNPLGLIIDDFDNYFRSDSSSQRKIQVLYGNYIFSGVFDLTIQDVFDKNEVPVLVCGDVVKNKSVKGKPFDIDSLVHLDYAILLLKMNEFKEVSVNDLEQLLGKDIEEYSVEHKHRKDYVDLEHVAFDIERGFNTWSVNEFAFLYIPEFKEVHKLMDGLPHSMRHLRGYMFS